MSSWAVLPTELAERCHWWRAQAPAEAGQYVLLWLHHAVRAEVNPALDVARSRAAELGLPLLVYQGLGGRHRYNNDRHHRFILEGARDLADDLAHLGLTLRFHLPPDPSRPSPLPQLAAGAALVVVEDYPAPPFPAWTRQLVARCHAPVVAVDSQCVLPMRMLDRRYQRAFEFRRAAQAGQRQRAAGGWSLSIQPVANYEGTLPFEPLALDQDLAPVIARCHIDHGVAPVPGFRGGRHAALARWRRFVEGGGLNRYAADRNDAARPGVSRLSPYLHHGHVSALELAHESLLHGGAGASKFLDELLVWRELAFNLACHADAEGLAMDQPEILPEWALASFRGHLADPRPEPTEESLERGRSGNPIWDAAQLSLLRGGELHNNLRMTWGKALVGWSRSVESALERLHRLNHRYALDGSDPNSYAGLGWCLGLYDRPFQPSQPVFGVLRTRSLQAHAARLDLDAYRQLSRPAGRETSILIIGAGVAGAMAGRLLADHGHPVRLLDKGRGAGGRMSLRRIDRWRFALGGERFALDAPELSCWRQLWLRDGVLEATDDGRLAPTTGANGLVRHLLADADVQFGSRVTGLRRHQGRWEAHDQQGRALADADTVLLALPPIQAAELLRPHLPDSAEHIGSIAMAPAWMLLCGFHTDAGPVPANSNADDGVLAEHHSRTLPDGGCALVARANRGWSEAHLEATATDAEAALWQALRARCESLPEAAIRQVHRWRYAEAAEPASGIGWVAELGLGWCGDWCQGGGIQGALLSAQALAARLLSPRESSVQLPNAPLR